ncbi:MAG: septum formation initiator family protein [Acidimicrobiia bacterium]|nr:septum formation initiator family protein [Acidimicrobiia bacterium]
MRRFSKPALWTATLALLVVGLAMVTAVIPFGQIVEQQRRVDFAAAELASLNEENLLLGEEVEALNTPQEIERLARERLGYVMPGDIPYVVLEPPADATTTTAPPSESIIPPQVPWYEAIWEFFTGADLVDG